MPRGAKDELDYGPELAEKIQKGEPLWDDEAKADGEEEDDGEKEELAEKLTVEDKRKMTMFGEGKFHIIPSFWRTLIYLKK